MTCTALLNRQTGKQVLLSQEKPQGAGTSHAIRLKREGRSFLCAALSAMLHPKSDAEIFYVEKAGSIVYTILLLLKNSGCHKAFVHWAGECTGLCSSQLLHVTGFVFTAMQTAGARHFACP